MFCAMLAGVGVRAAPGVMILPLERAFGWSVGTISGAVSINIILLGFTGPFLTGLVQVVGLKPETQASGGSKEGVVRYQLEAVYRESTHEIFPSTHTA